MEPLQDADFPEHEKLQKVKDEARHVSEFLEWFFLTPEGGRAQKRHTHPLSIERILADYFEIDLAELEHEKKQMLGIIRLGMKDDADRL